MPTSRERVVSALTEISARPTAPMFEWRVASYILSELERIGLPVGRDEYGNIIATYEGPNAPESGVAIVAHMDHPGLELADEAGTRGWLLGTVSQDCFRKRVSVRLYPALPAGDDDGVPGWVERAENVQGRTSLHLRLKGKPPELPAFGMWDFPPIKVQGDIAHMRAIDDVVGCAIALLVLEQLAERRSPCRCFGVFTRAEETGFLGAAPLARGGILPKETIVISLETSKALPGAEIGGGPVIRVGDRLNTFDGRAEVVLQVAAQQIAKADPAMKVQRQLMSGGACEASVFLLEGYPTTGVAIPLGNYHNMTEKTTLAAEYVHLNDVATAVELLARATEQPIESKLADREHFLARAEHQADRLRDTYRSWPEHQAPSTKHHEPL